MSFETWVNYGYGVCLCDLEKPLTYEGLNNLCGRSDNTLKLFIEDLEGCVEDVDLTTLPDNLEERAKALTEIVSSYISCRDFLDDVAEDDHGLHGIGKYLREVIFDKENVETYHCDDFDGATYLIITPSYPWTSITKEEKNLTEEKAEKIFKTYISILTDEEIEIGYQDVHNGG